jgi:hypothetical protein
VRFALDRRQEVLVSSRDDWDQRPAAAQLAGALRQRGAAMVCWTLVAVYQEQAGTEGPAQAGPESEPGRNASI